jgi:AcrR family transcriptional regulator
MPKTIDRRAGARASYHHGDLKQALLDAARAEVNANGAQGLSLASLARRAGVAQSAPYRHFTDREELLAAVATAGFEEFTTALLAAAQSGTEEGAVQRMAETYLRFGSENVELYRLMFASRLVPESASDSHLRKAAQASFQPLLDHISKAAASTIRGRALVFWAQLHGLVMLNADGLFPETLDELGEHLHL